MRKISFLLLAVVAAAALAGSALASRPTPPVIHPPVVPPVHPVHPIIPFPPVFSRGSIAFRVVSDQGAPVGGAVMSYANGPHGAHGVACTASSFGICLVNLPVGTYTFTAVACPYQGSATIAVRPYHMGMLIALTPFLVTSSAGTGVC